MPLYIFVRLEPRAGKDDLLLEELRRVVTPTRAEPGCLRINLYESTRGAHVFYLHSAWLDEAAFELHAELPHTQRFLGVVADLITHPFEAVRTRDAG